MDAAVPGGFAVDEDDAGDDHNAVVLAVGCISRRSTCGGCCRRRCCCSSRTCCCRFDGRSTPHERVVVAKPATLEVATTTTKNVTRKDAIQSIRTRIIVRYAVLMWEEAVWLDQENELTPGPKIVIDDSV